MDTQMYIYVISVTTVCIVATWFFPESFETGMYELHVSSFPFDGNFLSKK